MTEPYAYIESAQPPAIEFQDAMSMMVACAGAYSAGRPLKLGEPCTTSELSGNPGYRYHRGAVCFSLDVDELLRLVLNALRPDEVERLRARYGMIDELGEGLYNETHTAISPKVRVPSVPTHDA